MNDRGGEDHYTHACGAAGVACNYPGFTQKNGAWDLWEQGGSAGFPGVPLLGTNGTLDPDHVSGTNSSYSAELFGARAEALIANHDAASSSFFLYLALHNTHAPIEAPRRLVALYNETAGFEGDPQKAVFAAMVSSVDETVLRVVTALKKNDMWDDTLLVWTTDNGAPVSVGGSNAPPV